MMLFCRFFSLRIFERTQKGWCARPHSLFLPQLSIACFPAFFGRLRSSPSSSMSVLTMARKSFNAIFKCLLMTTRRWRDTRQTLREWSDLCENFNAQMVSGEWMCAVQQTNDATKHTMNDKCRCCVSHRTVVAYGMLSRFGSLGSIVPTMQRIK